MVFLQIGLTLAYFIYVGWLGIAIYVNYILKPWFAVSRNRDYTISEYTSGMYAIHLGLTLALPIAYGLILDPA